MSCRRSIKSPPVDWSVGVCKIPRISLFGVAIIYGTVRLISHTWSGPNYLGILSFSFQILLAIVAVVFLHLEHRPGRLELVSCGLAFLLQLLDVLGSMALQPLASLSWLARGHMMWSLGTAAFGWRPLLAGVFLQAVLSCHTAAVLVQLEDQTTFVLGDMVRDHLINFVLFAIVSFGAVVQLNHLLRQMWSAESRAKMEADVSEQLIAMTCDFDVLIGAVENHETDHFRVLKHSARASSVIGRALVVGDELETFLCDAAALQKSLAEAKELQPLLLPTRLLGLAQEEMQAHFLVVRRPEGLIDDYPVEVLPKEETLLATFLIAVRVDHTLNPPSELLPQTAPQVPISRLTSSSSTSHSVADTTVTGAFFGGLELNGTGMKSLLEIGHKEHWIISPELLQLHSTKLLGSGGFGLVCEGTFCGATVALKFPRKGIKDCKFQTPESREYILFMNYLSELRLLRHVRHPHLVSFFGATVDADTLELMLVFEKMTGRTLTKFLPSENPEEDVRLQILLDIAKALLYLHTLQPPVVHGDLKGDNIYVESGKDMPVTKLGDFGLARRATKSAAGMGGTLRWCAPEVLGGCWSPATPADSYSYGQVAFFVVSGRLPLAELKRHEMADALTKGKLPPEDWPVGYMVGVRNIAEACRKFEPEERPAIFTIWRDLTNLQVGETPARSARSAKLIGKSATTVLSASPSGSPRNSRLQHPFAAPLPAVPLLEPPSLELFGSATVSLHGSGPLLQTSSHDLEAQIDMARKHAFGRSPYY